MSTHQMVIRMPDELKAKAAKLAQTEGKNLSSLVRELLEEYVRDHDMGAFIDDLWLRVGDRMKKSGAGPEDIDSAIRATRAARVNK